jgi:hypothetical protein
VKPSDENSKPIERLSGLQLLSPFLRRYLHIKYRQLLDDLWRSYTWMKTRRSVNGRRRSIHVAILELRKHIVQCRADGAMGAVGFLNSVLFTALFELDTVILVEDVLLARHAWRRKLSARVALLSMHEFKFSEASGKELQEYVKTLLAPQQLKTEFDQARGQVSRAQAKLRHKLKVQRNSIIGHQSPFADVYYEEVLAINEYEIGDMAMQLIKTTHAFVLAAGMLTPYVAISTMSEPIQAEP